jgi:hypothetical protein
VKLHFSEKGIRKRMVAFSVIIPLYNRGDYIARAMFSVLNLSFQDFEIIIVDGDLFGGGFSSYLVSNPIIASDLP